MEEFMKGKGKKSPRLHRLHRYAIYRGTLPTCPNNSLMGAGSMGGLHPTLFLRPQTYLGTSEWNFFEIPTSGLRDNSHVQCRE